MGIDETLKREIVDAIVGDASPENRPMLSRYLNDNWEDIISSLLSGDWRKHGFRGIEVRAELLKRGAVKEDPSSSRLIVLRGRFYTELPELPLGVRNYTFDHPVVIRGEKLSHLQNFMEVTDAPPGFQWKGVANRKEWLEVPGPVRTMSEEEYQKLLEQSGVGWDYVQAAESFRQTKEAMKAAEEATMAAEERVGIDTRTEFRVEISETLKKGIIAAIVRKAKKGNKRAMARYFQQHWDDIVESDGDWEKYGPGAREIRETLILRGLYMEDPSTKRLVPAEWYYMELPDPAAYGRRYTLDTPPVVIRGIKTQRLIDVTERPEGFNWDKVSATGWVEVPGPARFLTEAEYIELIKWVEVGQEYVEAAERIAENKLKVEREAILRYMELSPNPIYPVGILDDWYVVDGDSLFSPKPGARICGILRIGRLWPQYPGGVRLEEGHRLSMLILSYNKDTAVRTPHQTFLLGSRKKLV